MTRDPFCATVDIRAREAVNENVLKSNCLVFIIMCDSRHTDSYVNVPMSF